MRKMHLCPRKQLVGLWVHLQQLRPSWSVQLRTSRQNGKPSLLADSPPLQFCNCRSVCAGWMKNLGMAPKRSASESKSSSAENGWKGSCLGESDNESGHNARVEALRKEAAREIASAALAAAKASAKAATDGKVEINEVRDFAGEEVRVTKFVDPSSKEAMLARRKAEMQASSSGLDALLEQIAKKQKLSILDKSRKDWGEFKEEKCLEDELEMHIKSGDKYTEKVAFLQRADLREYEKERDARLALLSKRRSEPAPVD